MVLDMLMRQYASLRGRTACSTSCGTHAGRYHVQCNILMSCKAVSAAMLWRAEPKTGCCLWQGITSLVYLTFLMWCPPLACSTWTSGETPDTAALKGAFAKKLGLAGIMFWELPSDTFQGKKYPIIRAASKALTS